MKICHFTSVHQSNDVRIFEKECVSLAQAGFEVFLVAAGEVDRIDKGVRVITVKAEKQGRLYRMRRFAKMIFEKALEIDADVYHFHDPELLRFVKKLKRLGKIVVYDIHEDLPRSILSKPYLKKWLRKLISYLIEKYENRIAAITSCNITATKHIEERFKKINPKTYSIYNYPVFKEVSEPIQFEEKNNAVCYVGGLTQIRGIYQILDAIEITDATLILAGVPENVGMLAKINNHVRNGKVFFEGKVNREGVDRILNHSKAGIVTFLPEPNHVFAQPNKIFEYMAAAIPVIASNFQIWKSIIVDNNCGLCVNPNNPKEIAEAIQYILMHTNEAKKMGENGRKAVAEKFNWKVEEKKLIELYEKFASNEEN